MTASSTRDRNANRTHDLATTTGAGLVQQTDLKFVSGSYHDGAGTGKTCRR